eukprot:scaffold222624_cov32-Tisochrysis_lutea.AAC.1
MGTSKTVLGPSESAVAAHRWASITGSSAPSHPSSSVLRAGVVDVALGAPPSSAVTTCAADSPACGCSRASSCCVTPTFVPPFAPSVPCVMATRPSMMEQ